MSSAFRFKKQSAIEACASLLILLFLYTAFSKLLDLAQFKEQLSRQPFGRQVSSVLLWLVPFLEIFTSILLFFSRTRLEGFLVSCAIMVAFTAYVVLILSHYWDRIPCSCGGVISRLSWGQHLWLNIAFLCIAVTGCIFIIKERRWLAAMG